MTIIPSGGIIASVAGTSLAQTAGTEANRAQQDANVQQRKFESELRAEATAGIARTGEDQEVSDRDADGRLPWHLHPHAPETDAEPADDPTAASEQAPNADDATGQHLDLIG